MKSLKLKIFLLLSLLLAGCTQSSEPINKNNENLKESMKNYYKTECKTNVSGEHFEIKVISVSKIPFKDESYDTSYTFYRYQILIAPILNEDILLQDIIITPSEKLNEYFDLAPEGRNNLKDFQLRIDKLDIDKKNGEENLLAYRMDITFSNLGDDYQSKSNVEQELFDQYMKELNIKIKFNNQEEIITVQFDDSIYIPDFSLGNTEREDLVEIHETGGTTSLFAPYDGDFLFE